MIKLRFKSDKDDEDFIIKREHLPKILLGLIIFLIILIIYLISHLDQLMEGLNLL